MSRWKWMTTNTKSDPDIGILFTFKHNTASYHPIRNWHVYLGPKIYKRERVRSLFFLISKLGERRKLSPLHLGFNFHNLEHFLRRIHSQGMRTPMQTSANGKESQFSALRNSRPIVSSTNVVLHWRGIRKPMFGSEFVFRGQGIYFSLAREYGLRSKHRFSYSSQKKRRWDLNILVAIFSKLRIAIILFQGQNNWNEYKRRSKHRPFMYIWTY